MKRLQNHCKILFSLAVLLSAGLSATTQDSAKKDLIVSIGYHNVNNEWAYLSIAAKAKIEGKFQPVKGTRIRLYLDKDSAACLIGNLMTDAIGEAIATLAPSLKDRWNSAPTHALIAISEGDAIFNPTKTDATVTKAHMKIDTGAGRTMIVSLMEWKEGTWTPVKGVEIKVDIKRSGRDLSAGDKESYTTDSTGSITAAFNRENMPGDKNGYLTLVAKIEDNDTYGNLRMEKTVPWGTILNLSSHFNDRSLWAARYKTPIWLLLMEYSIFFSVWGVIIYLLIQFKNIIKAGRPV